MRGIQPKVEWSGRVRKEGWKKIRKQLETGLLRFFYVMARSWNFIFKAMNNLWRIFFRERSDLPLKDHSVGSVENGSVLNICWVNEWFLNITLDLSIWWFFKLYYKYWQIGKVNNSEWWSGSNEEDRIAPDFSEH